MDKKLMDFLSFPRENADKERLFVLQKFSAGFVFSLGAWSSFFMD
jgi:hypothetical protein